MSHAGQEVEFERECDVVRIPSGEVLHVEAGTRAVVTQSLGGTFTLQIPASGAPRSPRWFDGRCDRSRAGCRTRSGSGPGG